MASASTPPSVSHVVVGPVDLEFTNATPPDVPVDDLRAIFGRLSRQPSYVTQEVWSPLE